MSLLKEKIELEVQEAELQAQKALQNFTPLQRKLLIFCLLAIIPAYYGAKTYSYNANTKAYAKYVITAQPSFSSALEPDIGKVIITQAGIGNYSVAVQVSNKNLALSLENTPFQFYLYNSSGAQVYTTSRDSLFLLPGETKYVFAPRVASKESIVSGKLIFPDTLHWQKRLTIPTVPLEASTPNYGNQTDPIAFYVAGTILNNSPYTLGEVTIGFLLRNTAGIVVATSQRSEFNLAPNERRAYRQLWPGIYSQDIARVEIHPVTDTLNNSNVTLPQDSVTPSSNLGRPSNNQ